MMVTMNGRTSVLIAPGRAWRRMPTAGEWTRPGRVERVFRRRLWALGEAFGGAK